jgi:hypothetical protein
MATQLLETLATNSLSHSKLTVKVLIYITALHIDKQLIKMEDVKSYINFTNFVTKLSWVSLLEAVSHSKY